MANTVGNARHVYGTAYESSAPIFMQRVTNNAGTNVTQATISSGVYTIYLLDEQNPDTRTVQTGHDGVSLTIASVVFDSLQTDAIWDSTDSTGYNFRHQPDISANSPFELVGRKYLVEYTLTPSSGQVIVFGFMVDVI